MLSKKVLDTDAFLDMPLSAQALYFHLAINADDEGFIGNPKRIRDYIGAGEDDLALLIEKRFVILFKSGVVVIRHWKTIIPFGAIALIRHCLQKKRQG